MFDPIPFSQQTVNNPRGYKNNVIITFLSAYFNCHTNVNKVNQFTASSFASIYPLSKRTLSRRNNTFENVNDLKKLFECFGGNLFLVKGDGFLKFDGLSIKAFAWNHTITFDLLTIGNTIELDASFDAAKPNVFVSPMLIKRNIEIPLGLIVGSSECCELYSLFFSAFNVVDQTLFDEFVDIQIFYD